METVILDSKCPNCGEAFKPDYIFGNMRRCAACKMWSVAISGNVNENVISKIVLFELTKEDLKQRLEKLLIDKCVRNVADILGNVTIHSFYLPVIEIGTGTERRLIPANMAYSGCFVSSLECSVYDDIFDITLQKSFSIDILRNERINVLDVDISKRDQDHEYGIFRHDFYKILYLPIYEISFDRSPEKWYCLGIHDFWGLDKTITHVKTLIEIREDDNSYSSKFAANALLIAFLLRLFSCSGSQHVLNWLGSTIVWLISSVLIGFIIGDILDRKKKRTRNQRIKEMLFNA